MPLFQKTVINKFLKSQSEDNLSKKWDDFRLHFHNPTIQENIKVAKEEQYQEGFLRDLFVNIFGYVLNPSNGYNLTTEYKNIKDSKKADGAIIFNEKVSAIIELKGTNTTDLSKIEEQAFGYKNNQKNCRYVITSNFEKIRFYVDDAIEHLEFNLFTLSREEFNILYLCLGAENLEADIAGKIKDQSVSQEDAITKKLYSEYSVFKRELFKNLTELNPAYDPLELFKKSQKLLDRLLFLFFGEDRGLLPPNSVRTILDDWNRLKELDEDIPLYNRFKKYFGYLNTGFKGKKHDVFAYNGGLFKPDEVLDNIKIGDEVLYTHTAKLADYDFASEVDVNILGHIFENSLNELDEVKAQLEGQEIDRSKTKRKKDGVFYTPKYITKYIVENTVGKLCEEKKAEIGVIEEEYTSDKNRQQRTKKILLDKLEAYRNWLLKITIVDPACGSGAFLNEALNFLIAEHQYIDELEAKVTGSSLAFAYYSESILENNLFGVDLNEESVEIAKLSLWLRTAEPNRKLNSLNENIKCGNSLIDYPEVAGDKAFDWHKEFPKIFANGGFDVVIGNPPYVDSESMVKYNFLEREWISKNYISAGGNWDLYIPFIEKSIQIVKPKNSYVSLITPNKWLALDYGKQIRKIVFDQLERLQDFTNVKVFESANISSMIFILNTNKTEHIYIDQMNDFNIIKKEEILNKDNLSLITSSGFKIINSILKLKFKVSDFYTVSGAFTTGEAYEIIPLLKNENNSEEFKLINTGTIDRYTSFWGKTPTTYLGNKLLYPVVYRQELKEKFPRRFDKMNTKKLIITGIRHFEVFYDKNNEYLAAKSTSILTSEENAYDYQGLCILNSKLIKFYIKESYESSSMGGGINFTPDLIRNLPFPNLDTNKFNFNEIGEIMLQKNKELQQVLDKFQHILQREFGLENLPKKLQNWNEISFSDFLKELSKLKINLTLSQKDDWEEYFQNAQKNAHEIAQEIEKTDNEIDAMVYELYGLTKEEISIVENA